jgi:hypothetical protein
MGTNETRDLSKAHDKAWEAHVHRMNSAPTQSPAQHFNAGWNAGVLTAPTVTVEQIAIALAKQSGISDPEIGEWEDWLPQAQAVLALFSNGDK